MKLVAQSLVPVEPLPYVHVGYLAAVDKPHVPPVAYTFPVLAAIAMVLVWRSDRWRRIVMTLFIISLFFIWFLAAITSTPDRVGGPDDDISEWRSLIVFVLLISTLFAVITMMLASLPIPKEQTILLPPPPKIQNVNSDRGSLLT